MVLLQKLEAWEYDPDSVDHDQRSEHRYCPNRPVPPQTLQGTIYFTCASISHILNSPLKLNPIVGINGGDQPPNQFCSYFKIVSIKITWRCT